MMEMQVNLFFPLFLILLFSHQHLYIRSLFRQGHLAYTIFKQNKREEKSFKDIDSDLFPSFSAAANKKVKRERKINASYCSLILKLFYFSRNQLGTELKLFFFFQITIKSPLVKRCRVEMDQLCQSLSEQQPLNKPVILIANGRQVNSMNLSKDKQKADISLLTPPFLSQLMKRRLCFKDKLEGLLVCSPVRYSTKGEGERKHAKI